MKINSNGGGHTTTVPKLMEILADEAYALDPRFEESDGGFFGDDGDTVWAFGNFANLSHVFDIVGSETEMQPLVDAISSHLASERYAKAKAEREALKALPPSSSSPCHNPGGHEWEGYVCIHCACSGRHVSLL